VVTDRSRPKGLPPLDFYRAGLEKALQIDTDGGTFDQVVERVQDGHAQYWPCGSSVIITQISGLSLHFWLASGTLAELQAVTPHILDFGREQGCTRATLTGRKGWLRSFLRDTGWKQSKIIQMEVEL
jgi:hypothetical protein